MEDEKKLTAPSVSSQQETAADKKSAPAETQSQPADTAAAASPAADAPKKPANTTRKKPSATRKKSTTGTAAKKTADKAAKNAGTTAAKKSAATPRKKPAAKPKPTAETAKAPEETPKQPDAAPEKTDAMLPETAAAVPTEATEEAARKEKRAADMTRTLQITIEQIMEESEKRAQAEADELPARPASEPAPEDADDADDEPEVTALDILHSVAKGLSKWLLLVVLFVAVIAGGGVAWLYRSATPDMIPQIEVTFAGQTPAVSAYNWKIPVVGHLFRRSYKETVSSKPTALEQDVTELTPRLRVTPVDYTTAFTVTDADGQEVYSGTAEGFSSYRFTANGNYTAKLVITREKEYADETEVIGSETRLFSFTVSHSPSLRISPARSVPGSVAAVCVGKTLDGKEPQLQTSLPHTAFLATANGWVSYLPLARDTEPGNYEVVVTADGFAKPLMLTVSAGDFAYVDYYSASQRNAYYIGDEDMPAAVKACLPGATALPQWLEDGFAEPLADYTTQLAFGTTEYVGRTRDERDTDPGTGGRTSVNVVVKTSARGMLTAPAAGRVMLADELPDPYGNTLVIDHGCGLLSIFYGLQELQVEHGDEVKQGQELAKAYRITVAEMRLMGVAIDPEPIWQNRSDALKQQ